MSMLCSFRERKALLNRRSVCALRWTRVAGRGDRPVDAHRDGACATLTIWRESGPPATRTEHAVRRTLYVRPAQLHDAPRRVLLRRAAGMVAWLSARGAEPDAH